ncbi:MAG: GeoRSP system SPASM domain protein [Thermodesulfovibrionales bacterium]
MKLKELSFPVRAYWDLVPAPPVSFVDYMKICEEIVGMKILYLDLSDTEFPLSDACIRILERLRNENIAVSLTVSGNCLAPSVIDLLSGFNLRALAIEVSSLDSLAFAAERILECRKLPSITSGARDKRKDFFGISFPVNRDNFRDLPEVVSLCRENEITRLVFPMQRLHKGADCFSAETHERQKLAERISRADLQNMKLTIHDPFLWKAFYPTVEFPEGGCQAANSMIYISSEGDVYPCPCLPLKFGSFGKDTLKEMMSSSQKKRLRELLSCPPEVCHDCLEVNQCAGGCRGRAYALADSLSVPDPSCR